jgi:hypothetical protein
MARARASSQAQAEAFFGRFADGFRTFEAGRIAALFVTPGVTLRRDGSIVALTSEQDVLRYYQAALDHYHHDGCRSCRWSQLTVSRIGRRCLLATVTWELLRDDLTLLTSWRQSYSLTTFGDNGPRIFASAQHAD